MGILLSQSARDFTSIIQKVKAHYPQFQLLKIIFFLLNIDFYILSVFPSKRYTLHFSNQPNTPCQNFGKYTDFSHISELIFYALFKILLYDNTLYLPIKSTRIFWETFKIQKKRFYAKKGDLHKDKLVRV